MMVLVRAMAGLIGWAFAFSLLYALHGIGVAHGWTAIAIGPTSLQIALLFAVWTLCVAALAGLTCHVWPRRRPVALLDWLAYVSALGGLGATIYTGLPIVLLA